MSGLTQMAALRYAWSQMTSTQRNTWRSRAKRGRYTKWHAFVIFNTDRLQQGKAISPTPVIGP